MPPYSGQFILSQPLVGPDRYERPLGFETVPSSFLAQPCRNSASPWLPSTSPLNQSALVPQQGRKHRPALLTPTMFTISSRWPERGDRKSNPDSHQGAWNSRALRAARGLQNENQ
jgi:hypothetical protein